jgi:hypothetical protein
MRESRLQRSGYRMLPMIDRFTFKLRHHPFPLGLWSQIQNKQ